MRRGLPLAAILGEVIEDTATVAGGDLDPTHSHIALRAPALELTSLALLEVGEGLKARRREENPGGGGDHGDG